MRKNFCGILSFRVWIFFTFLLSVTNTAQSLGALAWFFLAFFVCKSGKQLLCCTIYLSRLIGFKLFHFVCPRLFTQTRVLVSLREEFWGCSYLVKWGRTFVYDVSPRIDCFKLFQLLVSIANKKYRLYFYLKSLIANATGRMWESGNMKLDTHTFWIIPKQPSKLKFLLGRHLATNSFGLGELLYKSSRHLQNFRHQGD